MENRKKQQNFASALGFFLFFYLFYFLRSADRPSERQRKWPFKDICIYIYVHVAILTGAGIIFKDAFLFQFSPYSSRTVFDLSEK